MSALSSCCEPVRSLIFLCPGTFPLMESLQYFFARAILLELDDPLNILTPSCVFVVQFHASGFVVGTCMRPMNAPTGYKPAGLSVGNFGFSPNVLVLNRSSWCDVGKLRN